ncbi:hypothetical protein VZO05_14975 [Aggregatilineales bacterium SYSU G02658]
MPKSDIAVIVDDRVRLFSAVLAATDYPQTSQAVKRYHAHPHARTTLKHLNEMNAAAHPAAQGMQQLIHSGIPLHDIFSVALRTNFETYKFQGKPPVWLREEWLYQLTNFAQEMRLVSLWQNPISARAWEDAYTQMTNIFRPVAVKAFLKPFFGEIAEDLLVMPNLSYPAEVELGLRTPHQLLSLIPPPLAWGESNPWPFDEETNVTQSYRAALAQYCRILLTEYLRDNADRVAEASKKPLPVTPQLREKHPTWVDQFTALFISGVVYIYLEDHFSKLESNAFELMERKVRGMTLLGATISVMRRYINEYGNRYHSLADFLTIFPTQLRVAKTIVGS